MSKLTDFIAAKVRQDREKELNKSSRKIAFETAVSDFKKSVNEWLEEDLQEGRVQFRPSNSKTDITGSEIKCDGYPGIALSNELYANLGGNLGKITMHNSYGEVVFNCDEEKNWHPATPTKGYSGPTEVVDKDLFIDSIIQLLRKNNT